MNKLTFAHLKNVIFTTIAVLAVVFPLTIFFHTYGPSIEGKLFPIVSNFEIDSLERRSDSVFVIKGTMNKLRDDCPFVGATAYVSDPKLPQLIRLASIDFVETNNVITARIKGLQFWGPCNWKLRCQIIDIN